MLTTIRIRNFKRFAEVEVELGETVVLIGPNNSGKTTALQAIALWHIGVQRWLEKRRGKAAPEKRPGVTINRRDLIAVPVPDANLLWRDLHVRNVRKTDGKQTTRNVRVEIVVNGVTEGSAWKCGMEFDYANEESLYCRPLRINDDPAAGRMPVPEEAGRVRVAYLPPMSGLAANETRLDPGAIDVRLGEGRTAEVLRNLCHRICAGEGGEERWDTLRSQVESLFGVKLHEPTYIEARGEITMSYKDVGGTKLDLSSSGRGLQQTLLLLAHLHANPGAVLLLDEPDAHLEILRQRETYRVLTQVARERGCQIVAASHSEVVLNEAAGRDLVVAFVGRPHRIDDRGSQLLKALRDIGYDQYYQSEQAGWVLYVEGSTDLEILRVFAEKLDHPAKDVLNRPFVVYVANQPDRARAHFHGLREAKRDLVGIAVFDRLSDTLHTASGLSERMWSRREIENYLCQRETLLAWAQEAGEQREGGPLFAGSWRSAMEQSIVEIEDAMGKLGRGSPWSPDAKVSDDFLEPLFQDFYRRLGLPNLMNKSDYHTLARYIARDQISPDVVAVLEDIVQVARAAKPAREQ